MKGRHSITVDNTIWELAQDKIDISLSLFIENTLKIYLGQDDELGKLMKKEAELQREIDAIQSKICQLRDKQRKESEKQYLFDKPMLTVNRIHDRLGYVGENQLRKIANQNDLPPQQLIDYCKQQDNITIERFAELPKYPKY